MRAEQNFWRLLADYERLTQNEGVALGSESFDELEAIQTCKEELLPKLRALGREAGLDRKNSEVASRLDRVLANGRRNKKLVDAMLARVKSERQSLDAARHRLRNLGGAYGVEEHRATGFSARV